MRPFYILYMWGQSCQLLQIQKQKRGRLTEQWKYTILRIQHVLIYSVPGQVAREMIHKVLLNRGRLAIVLNTPKHEDAPYSITLKNLTIQWVKIFKNGPSKICGRHPLKNLKEYLKAVFCKFYLVHSWILWPKYPWKIRTDCHTFLIKCV